MILSFKKGGTEDVFNGVDSKIARKTCPQSIWRVARKKLDMIQAAQAKKDLLRPPGNRLKSLDGDREGQDSIRINDQYRICFVWTDKGADNVEITDYH